MAGVLLFHHSKAALASLTQALQLLQEVCSVFVLQRIDAGGDHDKSLAGWNAFVLAPCKDAVAPGT